MPGSGAHLRSVGGHLTAPAATSGDAGASTEAPVGHGQAPRYGERALTTPRSRAHAGRVGHGHAPRSTLVCAATKPRVARDAAFVYRYLGEVVDVLHRFAAPREVEPRPQWLTEENWGRAPSPGGDGMGHHAAAPQVSSCEVMGFSASSSGHMHCTRGAGEDTREGDPPIDGPCRPGALARRST